MTQTEANADELEETFHAAFPGGFFVDPNALPRLQAYVTRVGFLESGESLLSATKAGEGNMNLTLRLATADRSFILKQARPWVEKYPQIAAPANRALVEAEYYQACAARPALREKMPALLGSDAPSRVLALEDLGTAQDFTPLYGGARLAEDELEAIVDYLVVLHRPFSASEWGPDAESRRRLFANRAMRELNHEHIFRLPLAEGNGVDLDAFTEGLAKAARSLKGDQNYVDRTHRLGEIYLADGEILQHGDYFPGSWMRTENGIRIIDPEFCFMGTRAFDLGFALGHLHLADQPPHLGEQFLSLYADRTHAGEDVLSQARQFAAVEIMRRLLGVAQLPLMYDLAKKVELLELSRELMLGETMP